MKEMLGWVSEVRVYVVPGVTDMRKAIDGLSILVEECLERDPFSGHLFGFCNRRRDMVKVLYWDRNGFCLWQKRLERGKFKWPVGVEEVKSLSMREFEWLLEGFSVFELEMQESFRYESIT